MPLSASPASYSSTEGAEVTRPDRALIPPGLLILATEFGKRRVVDHHADYWPAISSSRAKWRQARADARLRQVLARDLEGAERRTLAAIVAE